MRVKMLKYATYETKPVIMGEEVEISEEVAKIWIKNKYAVLADEKKENGGTEKKAVDYVRHDS